MRWTVFTFILVLGCGSSTYDAPLHRTGLLRGDWDPLVQRTSMPSDEEAPPAASGQAPVESIREKMIDRAVSLLEGQSGGGGYGPEDLEPILTDLIPGIRWRAGDRLAALADEARSRDAYRTNGRPRPGDIVLFHNQVDANGNGELDDWLTGCGIVTKRRGEVFEAVVRTGNAPRLAVAWPDGPSVQVYRDEKVNSFIRIPHRSDPPQTRYLAGQLYAGHIDVDDLASGEPGK